MAKLLSLVISYALGSFLLRLFTTLGIGIFTYVGLSSLVRNGLDMIQPLLNGLPEYVLNIASIAGMPEAVSVIGSALLVRAAINSARAFVGVVS